MCFRQGLLSFTIILTVISRMLDGQLIPSFLETDGNVTYHIQDDAILECSIHNLGTKTVAWRKLPEEFPLTIGKLVYNQNEDVSVQFVKRTKEVTDWNLIIKDVQLQDEGTYECQISATTGYTRNVHLAVLDTPASPKPSIRIAGTEFVESDQPIKIMCNITRHDHAPQDIDWFKDGEKVRSEDNDNLFIDKKQSIMDKTLVSELLIRRAKASDAGTYVCRSSSRDVESITVHVLTANTNNVKRGNAYYQYGLTGTGVSHSAATSQFQRKQNYLISLVVILLMGNVT